MREGNPLRITFSGRAEPHLLRVITARGPARVVRDGRELAEGADWNFDESRGALVIRAASSITSTYEITWR